MVQANINCRNAFLLKRDQNVNAAIGEDCLHPYKFQKNNNFCKGLRTSYNVKLYEMHFT